MGVSPSPGQVCFATWPGKEFWTLARSVAVATRTKGAARSRRKRSVARIDFLMTRRYRSFRELSATAVAEIFGPPWFSQKRCNADHSSRSRARQIPTAFRSRASAGDRSPRSISSSRRECRAKTQYLELLPFRARRERSRPCSRRRASAEEGLGFLPTDGSPGAGGPVLRSISPVRMVVFRRGREGRRKKRGEGRENAPSTGPPAPREPVRAGHLSIRPRCSDRNKTAQGLSMSRLDRSRNLRSHETGICPS